MAHRSASNQDQGDRFADLSVVQSVRVALERLKNQPADEPKIGVLHGFSGAGKTTACVYGLREQQKAIYLACKSIWTRKDTLEALARAVGVQPGKTSNATYSNIVGQVLRLKGPIILDEADYLCKDSHIEMIRDIYDETGVIILLVGEEGLPQKLQRWERVHNRIYTWVAANPATLQDGRLLLAARYPRLKLSDEVLKLVIKESSGRIRRIITNFGRLSAAFPDARQDEITPDGAKAVGFATGMPPERRVGA